MDRDGEWPTLGHLRLTYLRGVLFFPVKLAGVSSYNGSNMVCGMIDVISNHDHYALTNPA